MTYVQALVIFLETCWEASVAFTEVNSWFLETERTTLLRGGLS